MLHPPKLHPIEITMPAFTPGADAITLWPFIFYRSGHQDDLPLRCHEHFHWRQASRWGVLPWYLTYLALLPFFLGQRNPRHPLEAPAYVVQNEVRVRLLNGQSVADLVRRLGVKLR